MQALKLERYPLRILLPERQIRRRGVSSVGGKPCCAPNFFFRAHFPRCALKFFCAYLPCCALNIFFFAHTFDTLPCYYPALHLPCCAPNFFFRHLPCYAVNKFFFFFLACTYSAVPLSCFLLTLLC